MQLSIAEENYLKTMFRIVLDNQSDTISSKQIADVLQIKPASVNNMLSRFKEKGLVDFRRYGKAVLTETGRLYGQRILRKHRLWETFLYKKLGFTWDEVHEVAEQLEHIKSDKLLDAIDKMLGFPKLDPHGEYIPPYKGAIPADNRMLLADAAPEGDFTVLGLRDSSNNMLDYLAKLNININTRVKVVSVIDFDGSVELLIDGRTIIVSNKVANNIYVE